MLSSSCTFLKRNLARHVPISCPLCILKNDGPHHHECFKDEHFHKQQHDRFMFPASLAKHLRSYHSLALFGVSSTIIEETGRNRSNALVQFRKDSFVKDQMLGASVSRKTKQIVRLSSCLDHFDRKGSRSGFFIFSCTSQADHDAVSALCRIYSRLAIGKIPLIFPPTSSDDNDNEKGKNFACIRQRQASLIFIDFANQPDIFDHFQHVDPGAEFFLSRRAIIIVIWEPRVHISKLLSSPFARNAMMHRRIFVHQCRRDRESGDLAMADVISRIHFEIQQTIYLNCEQEQFPQMMENNVDREVCGDPTTVHKFHIVGNDLRHRRCLQDVVGKDLIVGHHSFENTAFHWQRTLKNLLFKCLPCECGKEVPKNTKFPHTELNLRLQSN